MAALTLPCTLAARSPLVVPGRCRAHSIQPRTSSIRALATASTPGAAKSVTWAPQDLTKDCPGYAPIPEEDYVKQYQRNPELWPVEFFLIAYRRRRNKNTQKRETQVLVRRSANGTSKYGVGTGVPATRWVLSTSENPPRGYAWSELAAPTTSEALRIRFAASNFPEFPHGEKAWAYDKIDILEDAFKVPDVEDSELEEFANKIREGLRIKLSAQMNDGENMSSWEASTVSVVKNIIDKPNSLAAIQGTLRMSGLFESKEVGAARDVSTCRRYVGLGADAPDHAKMVESVRIYTMFPQMPDPMPVPSTPPEELQKEISSREARMAETGRDLHKDRHGRKFTHKSTSNVSNTIHGVYISVDLSDLAGLDEVPALDLFGTKKIPREWKSLQDLKVLDSDGNISTEDTKPTFISGFIVRQLANDGVIQM